jgi:hypothetical protein
MRTLTAAAAVVMVVAIVATLAIISRQLGAGTGLGSVYGARFGMSKEATQLHFRDASLGKWRAANGKEYELLYWQRGRSSTLGSPSGAAFVFHGGLLTAVRLHLDEDAARTQTAALDSNESVMLSTKRDSEGMVLTYALRLCDINDGSSSAARQRWSEIESLLQADPRQVDVSLRGERTSLRAFD